MKTKAQISRQKYGASLSELTPGEKAAVTRAYNAQSNTRTAPVARKPAAQTGIVYEVKIGRPGVNGTKTALINAGTPMEQVLEQADIKINKSKEGVLDKASGDVVLYTDEIAKDCTLMICPGIDSSC